MSHDHSDSAGVPWEGRSFHDNPHAGDNGETPPEVATRLNAWRTGTGAFTDFVAAVASSRLLIPLVAHAGDDFDPDHPVMEDKVQELSVVTVAGPNGEKVIPAFTSVVAMTAWNRDARPIPIEAQRVALAAASEQTDRIVLNPGTDSIVIRRPAVWAIAKGETYIACWESIDFLAQARELLAGIPDLAGVRIQSADPAATGNGPDVALVLELPEGLTDDDVRATVGAVHARVSVSESFREAVDALTISLVTTER